MSGIKEALHLFVIMSACQAQRVGDIWGRKGKNPRCNRDTSVSSVSVLHRKAHMCFLLPSKMGRVGSNTE